MAVKKIRYRHIKVSPSMRKELAQEFRTTIQTIGNALRHRTQGPIPERIRERALNLGGVEVIDTELVDC